MYGIILFTDIVGSSYLWNKYNKKMISIIKKHNNIINTYSKKYNGKIIKNIGDSFMILFNKNNCVEWACRFSINLQNKFTNDGIIIDKDKLKIRIGFCYGKLYKIKSNIQSCNNDDYLGNTVNVASRMESVVSPISGFAFSFLLDNDEDIIYHINSSVLDMLKKCDTNIHIFNNGDDTYIPKRSGKLLTFDHITFDDPKKLKSVEKILVFKCCLI